MHALIIEDIFDIATYIAHVLNRVGFTTYDLAPTEAEAITLARKRCPDLITVDLVLKAGDGGKAGDEIVRTCGSARVFVTAYPERVRNGSAIVLPKPFTQAELMKAAMKALSDSRKTTPPKA